jgi:hypothetical protein
MKEEAPSEREGQFTNYPIYPTDTKILKDLVGLF